MSNFASPVADELIELRGLRLHYRDWPSRKPGAPALVLLHGYTGHARTWDSFAEAMTDRYRVIALDQRGHGESGWADRYGVDDMVDDLAAFVAALLLDHFTLLGLSMGGMVTMAYAGRRPVELAACVIVDIGPELDPVGVARIGEAQAMSDVFDSKDAAFAAARAREALAPDDALRHRVDYSLMRLADGRWTWRYDRALRSTGGLKLRKAEDGWASCARIAVPTQLICGDVTDIISPQVAERMIRTIPDARLATVARAGHAVPLDAPEGFLAAARQFLLG